jgi:hypothetical protein
LLRSILAAAGDPCPRRLFCEAIVSFPVALVPAGLHSE